MGMSEYDSDQAFARAEVALDEFRRDGETRQRCPECAGQLTMRTWGNNGQVSCETGDFHVTFLFRA